jgi:hypothetical protein
LARGHTAVAWPSRGRCVQMIRQVTNGGRVRQVRRFCVGCRAAWDSVPHGIPQPHRRFQ